MAKANKAKPAVQGSSDWSDVFKANPDVTEIFVVDGMPFTNKTAADNYAYTINRMKSDDDKVTVEVVAKGAAPETAPETAPVVD